MPKSKVNWIPFHETAAASEDYNARLTIKNDGWLVHINAVDQTTDWLKITFALDTGQSGYKLHKDLHHDVQTSDQGVTWQGRVYVRAGDIVLVRIEDAISADIIKVHVGVEVD